MTKFSISKSTFKNLAAKQDCCQFIEIDYLCIQTHFAIATDKLNIDQLKEKFRGKETFETNDIARFYEKDEPQIKIATVNWRIYHLVQRGILKRVGRGKLALGESKIYLPEISSKLKSIHSKLKREFPYLEICIWNTSSFNEFMIHQPGRFYILIEVEKEATQSVFFFLKDEKYPVFVEPTEEIFEKYLSEEKDNLVVKSLITEAPLQKIAGLNTVTIEKMLVDIFCDELVFSAQQGSEMRTIYMEAMNKYSINENRMLRYADRRRKKDSFRNYLNAISNLRQQS